MTEKNTPNNEDSINDLIDPDADEQFQEEVSTEEEK